MPGTKGAGGKRTQDHNSRDIAGFKQMTEEGV